MSAQPLGHSADLSKERLRLWIRLLKATKLVENDLRDRLRRTFETTLPRFDVLAMLDKSGTGLKMSELSAELMVSNGNVTGIIDRLVLDGLVERVPIQGDRRATLVRLTSTGRRQFREMANAHETWINALLESLGSQDIENATNILSAIGKPTR